MRTLKAIYARDIQEDDILNSDQKVQSIEIGDRWVWILTASGDTVVYPVWRVVNIRRL